MKRVITTLVAILALAAAAAAAAGCGGSSDAEEGPQLTGYGATREDFAEGKELDTDHPDDCCFLPKQADGSSRYNNVLYDDNDRVFAYSMSFAPTIVIAGAQNVILGELPDDAKLVFKATRKGCEVRHYQSASIRQVFPPGGGPWDILVSLYSSFEATPAFDGINVTEINFSNVKAGDQQVEC